MQAAFASRVSTRARTAQVARKAPACLRATRVSAPTSRRTTVDVKAFRESPRTEQLVGVAREFANTWVSLVTKGPSSDRISCLTQLSAPGLTLRSTHPLGCVSVKGVDGVAGKLEGDFKTYKSSESGANVVLVAANETSDVAFALLSLPAPTSEQGTNGQVWVCLKMDIELDDTAARVQSVLERGLLPASLANHTGGAQGGVLRSQDAGDKQQGLVFERGSKHGTGLHSHSPTTPFPKDLLKPWGAQGSKTKKTSYSHGPSFTGGQSQGTSAEVKAPAAAPGSEGVAGQGTGAAKPGEGVSSSAPVVGDATQVAEGAIRAWASAWGSSGDEKALKQVLADGFKMFDAYGQLPLRHGKNVDAEASVMTAVLTGVDDAIDAISATKESFKTQQDLVDWAISSETAAGFSHWQSKLDGQSSAAQGEKDWDMEGLECNIFDPASGRLNAVYVWRDSLHVHPRKQQ